MIDYTIHKMILLASGQSESALDAQRALMKLAVAEFQTKLIRAIEAVPEKEFIVSVKYTREQLTKLIIGLNP